MTSEPHATPGADHAGFVDAYLPEDEALVSARGRAAELGCPAVGTAAAALLRFLASALRARAVVEVGTGAGLSGLALLRGMADDGVLTSIDIEPEYQRVARKTFLEAGIAPGRTRLIMGRALEVLPRLTTGGYDLVFVDASRAEYPHYYQHGVQLLREGGVIAFHDVLAGGWVDDPARRDVEALALREAARLVREDERLVPALVPVGSGLLVAAVGTVP